MGRPPQPSFSARRSKNQNSNGAFFLRAGAHPWVFIQLGLGLLQPKTSSHRVPMGIGSFQCAGSLRNERSMSDDGGIVETNADVANGELTDDEPTANGERGSTSQFEHKKTYPRAHDTGSVSSGRTAGRRSASKATRQSSSSKARTGLRASDSQSATRLGAALAFARAPAD